MKKIIIDRIKNQNLLNESNDPGEEKSISSQKDYLLKRIEEKWSELKNCPIKNSDVSEEINELKQSKIFLSNINDSSFSLTKILESHKVFQSCRTKVVPRTEYLNTFNVKLKDFDYRNLITYSLINNKIYQAFLTILRDFEPDYKRSTEFQMNPIANQDFTLEYMLNCVANEIPRSIKLTVDFLKQVPGFGELPGEQFSQIVKRGIMDFHVITAAPMIRDGESYMILRNGVHLSRNWLNKMRGKDKTNLKIDAAESINHLGINDREKALLLVYLFSLPGENFADFNDSLTTLNEFYKRALLYEFDLNQRNQQFVIDFERVIEKLNKNREIHSQN